MMKTEVRGGWMTSRVVRSGVVRRRETHNRTQKYRPGIKYRKLDVCSLTNMKYIVV